MEKWLTVAVALALSGCLNLPGYTGPDGSTDTDTDSDSDSDSDTDVDSDADSDTDADADSDTDTDADTDTDTSTDSDTSEDAGPEPTCEEEPEMIICEKELACGDWSWTDQENCENCYINGTEEECGFDTTCSDPDGYNACVCSALAVYSDCYIFLNYAGAICWNSYCN